MLKVVTVDYQVAANATDHVTDEYELTQTRVEDHKVINPQLVVRRGLPFDIVIRFDRNYDNVTDDLKLLFDTGEST